MSLQNEQAKSATPTQSPRNVFELFRRSGTAWDWYITTINTISGILLALMMLLIVTNIIVRAVTWSIPGSVEITEFIMPFVVFLSLGYVQFKKSHIRVEIITGRLPRKARAVVDIVDLLLVGLFFAIVAWQTWGSFTSSFDYREASDGILAVPIYPGKFVVVFGSIIMVIQLVKDIGIRIKDYRRGA
jgi:TRAP-type C4-dicarboxylate transport system permease small subunit